MTESVLLAMVIVEKHTMQLMCMGRSWDYYVRRHLRRERQQAAQESQRKKLPKKVSQDLNFQPCGIVHLDGCWIPFFGNPFSQSSDLSRHYEQLSVTRYGEYMYQMSHLTPGELTDAMWFTGTIDWNQGTKLSAFESATYVKEPESSVTPLEALAAMEGLEAVKEEFHMIKALIEANTRRNGRLKAQDLNLVIMGNPGTGKRTVAEIYSTFLKQSGLCTVNTSRTSDLRTYMSLFRESSDDESSMGFESNSRNTAPLRHNTQQFKVHHIRASEGSNNLYFYQKADISLSHEVVVLTGTEKAVTNWLGQSSRSKQHFLRRLTCNDLTAQQLRQILIKMIEKEGLVIQEGSSVPATLIAATKICRGKASPGYANAHQLAPLISKIIQRQALRQTPSTGRERPLPRENVTPRQDVHNKVFCDGPLCDPSNHIRGIRYKCLVCLNIDFCASCVCHPTNTHNKAHPLLQFRVPVRHIKIARSMRVQPTSALVGIRDQESVADDDKNETDLDSGNSGDTSGVKDKDNSSKHDKGRKENNHEDDTQRKASLSKDLEESSASILTFEDVVGTPPVDARNISAAWIDLSAMVGLEDVKKSIEALFLRAKNNYDREIQGKEPLYITLNRVFMGPPGTGKTTVAMLYGQALADIGLLSTKEVIYKTPADFIGEYIGKSEAKTKEILNATAGKVLIIDDAHMFYSGKRAGGSHTSDIFRLACIDVIVSMIHNRPGEDRCVILIGYTDMMEEMFRCVNPGLQRRFPLDDAFRFEDYDNVQLSEILKLKMSKEDVQATDEAMEVAAEALRRARDRPNFGNGGDVENLLTRAKTNFRARLEKEKASHADIEDLELNDHDSSIPSRGKNQFGLDLLNVLLEPEDFDPEWNRGMTASEKCRALFEGLIGFDSIIEKFEGIQRTAANLRKRGKDPRETISFTYVFKGPPGTGKTHTARILGQIFYDMGFLSTNDVIDCSASDLVAGYVGQTSSKVKDLFERALGKVLFIDEAYRLSLGAKKGRLVQGFEEEAIGEIVDCMTKPRYHKKMIIVLAGYGKEMNGFMKVNPGLRSRFPTDIAFPPMNALRSRELLVDMLGKKDIEVFDETPTGIEAKEKVLRLLDKLGQTEGWAGARDVKTLAAYITERVYSAAEAITGKAIEDGKPFQISIFELIEDLKDMLSQRLKGMKSQA